MNKIILAVLAAVIVTGCEKQQPHPTQSPATVSASAPAPAPAPINPKELATCSAEGNALRRLACFDEISQRHGQAPRSESTTAANKGNWATSTDVDPLTDKRVHYAILTASEGRGRFGDNISLVVRCKNGQTEAYINWATFLGSNGIDVTSRIDKAAATSSTWGISTDHKGSFMPNPVLTLKKFVGGSSYVVNLTPYSESSVTAIFDITGAADAFADIRRDCKW